LTSLKSRNKICTVIPFYNEEKHLPEVVGKTLQHSDILILVNDGSTDSARKRIPEDPRIIVIDHASNLGKGRALLTGLSKSIELDTAVTLTLDADGQHDPSMIPHFIEKIEGFDLLIGSRKKSGTDMPFHRRISNYLTSKLLSIKTGVKISDSQSGYRAFRTEICMKILPEFSGFEAESEMIVKACRRGFKIGFIEIPTVYGDNSSKMKAIPTIIGFIKVLLKS
jgi:glycosyltransferase involved in cell wall biosynthesis